MKKITLSYLAGYLLVGGVGFAFIPELTLRFFLSNGEYDAVMVRVVGMFMIALSGLISQFVRFEDYKYYPYSVYIRSFIVIFLGGLYLSSRDPLFLVLNGIVLLGLLPSIFELVRGKG